MQPDNERGRPHHGPASEDLATPQQLDLTVTDGTAPGDTRPRTEPDPAARRRNLEEARKRQQVIRQEIDDAATAVLANSPVAARREAERCLRELAATGEQFDAETLRERMGGHIFGAHASAMSAVFRMAARDGVIRQVGWRESTREAARGRALRVWVGTGVV